MYSVPFLAFFGTHRELYAVLKTENPVVSFLKDPEGQHKTYLTI